MQVKWFCLWILIFLTSCRQAENEISLSEFSHSSCSKATLNTDEKKILEQTYANEAFKIKITSVAECGENLLGKADFNGSTLNLYYTNEGSAFDYYLPQPPPPRIILQPNSMADIDTNSIEEELVNLCYCEYELTYEISGLKQIPTKITVNTELVNRK